MCSTKGVIWPCVSLILTQTTPTTFCWMTARPPTQKGSLTSASTSSRASRALSEDLAGIISEESLLLPTHYTVSSCKTTFIYRCLLRIIHTFIYSEIYRRIGTNTKSHTHTCMQAKTYTNTHTQTHTHIYIHAYTHTCCICKHIHTHTRTHIF